MNNEQLPMKTEEQPKSGAASLIFDIIEMFAWSLFAVFLIFTFAFRLCQVDGSSMENTLYEKENLVVYSLNYTPKQDDIIVFHMTNSDVYLEKTLVKRVIATGGQTLFIDFNTNEIMVDGVKYADSHAVLKNIATNEITGIYNSALNLQSPYYSRETNTLSLIVPENHLFVLGDNRNNSKDSRSPDILFVDERCVLGKVVLRISPFTVFS